MILVDFDPNEGYPRLGLVIEGQRVVEVGESPNGTLMSFILNGQHRMDDLREVALTGKPIINGRERRVFDLASIRLHAPIRHPRSLRDFYAFEAHVQTANANRGRDVPPAWYEIPVFYFSNPNAIFGEGDTIPYPRKSKALDYELEVACVIGKQGQDISADAAEDYIFGYVIMNDWSARDLQKQEMSVGLGPAKGKDFATSLGAYLVTPDELADRHAGRVGVYDLSMVARVNGEERSRGNWADIYWSFGQMLERASDGVTLYPGEVIGSGTVGTGCLLETTRAQGPWLQSGDVVELEIERLGVLKNTIM
ncbi:MAG: fumarylacetoacetate hydrolase family protein [Phototrophicales bacterium]